MQLQRHKTGVRTSISYTLHGDYYLPNLVLSLEETQQIGIWGQRYLQYIKDRKKVYYTILFASGRLNSYLKEIDKQAEETFTTLVEQMAKHEGIIEQLKEKDQLEWVQQMNNIRSRATEIVNAEWIYIYFQVLLGFLCN